jgi:hypothetical protein
MAKKAMAKSINTPLSKQDQKLARYLVVIPVLALLVKFTVMSNIQAGGWYGADGENYVAGVDGLLKDGLFSQVGVLSYWPAGYPILIWPLAALSITKFVYLLSFLQSLFFAFSTWHFTNQLKRSNLKKYALLSSIFISFNPTLSLSTLVIGYELPVASCLILASSLIIKNYLEKDSSPSKYLIFAVGAIQSLANFMQPRIILIGAFMILIWISSLSNKVVRLKVAAICTILMLVLPGLLMLRNSQANGFSAISTNLGVTMKLGAGETTNGGFPHKGPEIVCPEVKGNNAQVDNQVVKCVLSWYLSHPVKTVGLVFNKAIFYWSPWSGPIATGSMARNPWLKIAPTQSIARNAEGHKLIYGTFGKFASYVWVFGQVTLLIVGFSVLRRSSEIGKFASLLIATPVVLSWLISMATLGDHRMRLTTMTLSLFLQAVGFIAIRDRLSKAL